MREKKMKRCTNCHLYTKSDAYITEPYEECRLCGIVKPYESKN